MPEWFIDVCKQNIETFGLYFGASLLPLLYVFALAYCLIKEKRAWIKIVLLTFRIVRIQISPYYKGFKSVSLKPGGYR